MFSVVLFNPMGGLMLERESYTTSPGGGRSILEVYLDNVSSSIIYRGIFLTKKTGLIRDAAKKSA